MSKMKKYCAHTKQMCPRQNEWPADKRGQDGCDKAFLLHPFLLLRQILWKLDANEWKKCLRTRRTLLISMPPHLARLTLLCIIRPKSKMHTPASWRIDPSCSRTLLDSAFENEAKCKSETEAAKREVLRLSDKFEQVWDASNCFSPTHDSPPSLLLLFLKNREKGMFNFVYSFSI